MGRRRKDDITPLIVGLFTLAIFGIQAVIYLTIFIIGYIICFFEDINQYKLWKYFCISCPILLLAYFISFAPYIYSWAKYECFPIAIIATIIFIIFWTIIINKSKQKEQAALWEQKGYWLGLSGWEYEKEVAKIFRKYGYKATVTKGSRDGGVDIILKENGTTTYVQCKFYNTNKIPPSCIRELYGTMHSDKIYSGILVGGNAGFSIGTRIFARKNHIRLYSLNDIIKMSMELTGKENKPIGKRSITKNWIDKYIK